MSLVRLPNCYELIVKAKIIAPPAGFLVDLQPLMADGGQDALEALNAMAWQAYHKRQHLSALHHAEIGLRLSSRYSLETPRSRSDQDPQRRRLESITQLLILWDKCTAWLGLVSDDQPNSVGISRDLRIAFKALGKREAANRALSVAAFGHLRLGQFAAVQEAISRGLSVSNDPISKRALIDAKAALAAKTHFHREAAHLYEAVCEIDQVHGTTQSSAALADGFRLLAYSRLYQGQERSRFLTAALHRAHTCHREGHHGFALQLITSILDGLFEEGAYERMEEVITKAAPILKNSDAFPIGSSNLVLWANLVQEMVPRSTLVGLGSGVGQRNSGDVAWARISTVQDLNLRRLLFDALRALKASQPVSALENICLATEYCSRALLEKNGIPSSTARGKKLPMGTKRRLLRAAGLLSPLNAYMLGRVLAIRNKLFHGAPDALSVRSVSSINVALQLYGWLCKFVESTDLSDWRFLEDKQHRITRLFLSSQKKDQVR